MTVVSIVLLVVLLLAAGVIGYGVMIYNGLIALKHNIDKSWSNIDVILKQRFDELPKLLKVCEGYMQHERDTLEAVVKARSMISKAGNENEQIAAQSALSGALKTLFAVVEKYPELKADVAFRQLQSRVTELENQIADRREFFNESVNLFNIRIEQVPDVFVASMLRYTPRRLWEIKAEHREDIDMTFRRK